MNLEDIRKLLDMMNEFELLELEIKEGENSIRIKKKGGEERIGMPIASVPVQAGQSHRQVDSGEEGGEVGRITPQPPEVRREEIKSPMVGTFYKSPSPESPPFVEPGHEVKKGDVLCIIEAMKIMNEIEAEFPCRVIKILHENAEPVEFGEPLFIVERL